MKTIREILQLATEYLKKHHISTARRDADELLGFYLNLKRLDLYMQFDRPLEEKELTLFRESLMRRGKGEPLDYIFGKKQFFNLQLTITPAVLIPRQETEILLSRICEELKTCKLEDKVAWDICTGSGCLGLGLKKAFPQLRVFLSDLSPEALALAEKNRILNQLEVDLVQGDLLEPFIGKKADFILCNPPYISSQEYDKLEREVHDFEPKIALLAGSTGLEFYERLARELPLFLNPGGKVFFEIGASQGDAVKKLFMESCWNQVSIERDWAGHERFFFLSYFP